MRLFLDSFQPYGPCSNPTESVAAAALLPKAWQIAIPGADGITTDGPNGNFACELGTMQQTVPDSTSLGVLWKYKIKTNGQVGQILQIAQVDNNHFYRVLFRLQLETDGRLSMYAGNNFMISTTGAQALLTNTWYSLEVNFHSLALGSGNIGITPWLQINGVTVLASAAPADTGFTSISSLNFSNGATMVTFGGSGPIIHDQFAAPLIYDDQKDMGATWNITSEQALITFAPLMWVGDSDMGISLPASDTLAQWTSTGGNQFSQINNNPPNLSTNVSSSTVGQKDALGYQPVVNKPIKTLQYRVFANKNDAGTREISLRSGAGATEILSPPISLSDDPIYVIGGRDNDPATGLQWTQATVNAKDFGFNLDA